MTAVRVLKGRRTLGRKPRDAPTSPEMPRVFRRYYERFDDLDSVGEPISRMTCGD